MNPKRLLIAVDASANSERAVAYVGDILCHAREAEILLLCLSKMPDRDLFPDDAAWQASVKKQETEYKDFLARARNSLVQRGVDTGCVETRLVSFEGDSVAQGILGEQRKGGYGTIVVGRRGMSKQEEFLFGSVSSRVVHHARNCAVWVVE